MFRISIIKNYIKDNRALFFGIIILYFIGFIVGGIYSNFIDEAVFLSSLDNTGEFFKSLMVSGDAVNLRELIIADAAPILIIAACGIFLAGFPLILFLIFRSGFSLGFYICFLIKAFSLKGFYLGMFYLFLNLLLVLPALTVISANATDINLYMLAVINKKYAAQRNFSVSAASCVFVLILCLLLIVFSANLKALLLPLIVKFLFSSIL